MIRTHPLHGLGRSAGHPTHGPSGGGAAAPISPLDFSPDVWIDQKDSAVTSTVGAYAAGASVDGITNQGSATFDLVQLVGAQQPVLTDVGGKLLLEFSGAQALNCVAAGGAPAFSGDYTIAFVFDFTAANSRYIITKLNEYGVRTIFSSLARLTPGTGDGPNMQEPSGLHIFAVRVSSGSAEIWIRGATNTENTGITNAAAVSGSSDLCIGALNSGGSSGVEGFMGDLVMWNSSKSLSDLNTLLSGYHAAQYGITWTDLT